MKDYVKNYEILVTYIQESRICVCACGMCVTANKTLPKNYFIRVSTLINFSYIEIHIISYSHRYVLEFTIFLKDPRILHVFNKSEYCVIFCNFRIFIAFAKFILIHRN